jgi:hypothetical protein
MAFPHLWCSLDRSIVIEAEGTRAFQLAVEYLVQSGKLGAALMELTRKIIRALDEKDARLRHPPADRSSETTALES